MPKNTLFWSSALSKTFLPKVMAHKLTQKRFRRISSGLRTGTAPYPDNGEQLVRCACSQQKIFVRKKQTIERATKMKNRRQQHLAWRLPILCSWNYDLELLEVSAPRLLAPFDNVAESLLTPLPAVSLEDSRVQCNSKLSSHSLVSFEIFGLLKPLISRVFLKKFSEVS